MFIITKNRSAFIYPVKFYGVFPLRWNITPKIDFFVTSNANLSFENCTTKNFCSENISLISIVELQYCTTCQLSIGFQYSVALSSQKCDKIAFSISLTQFHWHQAQSSRSFHSGLFVFAETKIKTLQSGDIALISSAIYKVSSFVCCKQFGYVLAN